MNLDAATSTATLLVPALQPADWPGRAHAVHQPIVKGASPWIPLLTFADDSPHTRQIRTAGDAEALRQASSANLRKLPYQIGILDDPEGPPFAMAMLEGDEYAAEQVLNPEAMRHVAYKLGCKDLVVGVPRRGVLIAADAGLPREMMSFFLQFVSAQYWRANTGGLSPVGLLVVDGVVCGSAAGMEESGRADAESHPEVPIDVAVSTVGDRVEVRASGPDLHQVSAPLLGGLMRHLVARGLSGNTAPVDIDVHLSRMSLRPDEVPGFVHYVESSVAQQPGVIARAGVVRVFLDGVEQASIANGVPDDLLRALGLAPIAVFVLVAAADGRFDEPEIEALRASLMASHPLFLAGIQRNGLRLEEAIARLLSDGARMLGVLKTTADLVRRHVPQESDRLLGDLVGTAEAVAAATARPTWFGFGAPKVGADEARAVEMVRTLLA
ncbi:MAG: hypothetical protein H6737_13900 [Alphaproteobacteria bacterium]|nr:hypothetical protein [Alphaproteobacteria bacterium]